MCPQSSKRATGTCKHGSRMYTDWFLKQVPIAQASRGGLGHGPQWKFFWDFNSLKSPFLGSKSFKQDIGQFHAPGMKPCNLESFLSLFKIHPLCKIWLISVKWWKPVWICAWHGNDITVVSDFYKEQIKEVHGKRPDELLNFSLKNIVFLRVTWGLN